MFLIDPLNKNGALAQLPDRVSPGHVNCQVFVTVLAPFFITLARCVWSIFFFIAQEVGLKEDERFKGQVLAAEV